MCISYTGRRGMLFENQKDIKSTIKSSRTLLLLLVPIRSREVSKPRDSVLNYHIDLNFYSRLDNSAAETPANFQGDTIIESTILGPDSI